MPRRRRKRGVISEWLLHLAMIVLWGIIGLAVLSAVWIWVSTQAQVYQLQASLAVGVGVFLLGGVVVIYSSRKLRAFREQHRIKYSLRELLALSPAAFEHAVRNILESNGYTDIRHVGRAGDAGADLLCRDIAGTGMVVQCKHYSRTHPVGPGEVRELAGTLADPRFHGRIGMLITTSSFTRGAIMSGGTHGIRLLDGQGLARMSGDVDFIGLGDASLGQGAWQETDASGRPLPRMSSSAPDIAAHHDTPTRRLPRQPR